MSTKTTFKRISLVAVATLGAGVLSVAPASAAVPDIAGLVTHSLSSASSSVAVGTAATTTYTIGGTSGAIGAGSVVITETFPLDAAAGAQGATAAAGSALTAATSAAQATAGGNLTPTTTGATGAFSASHVMTVTPDKPGVYTVTFTPAIAKFSSAGVAVDPSVQVAAITWTIYAGYSMNATYPNTAFPTVGVNTTTGWSTTAGGRGTVRITNLPAASNTFYVTATGGSIQSYAEVGTDASLGTYANTNASNLLDGFNFTSTTPISAAAIDVTVLSTTDDVTVKVAYFSASGALTTFSSAVMTVGAAAALSVTESTAYLGTGASNPTVAATDDVITADGTVGTQRANVAITLMDQYKNARFSQTLSATVSGPALIAFSQATQATQGTASAASLVLTSSQNTAFLGINGTGVGGTATITISAGTTVIATKTLAFAGIATQLKDSNVDADKASLNKVYIGKAETGILTVSSYDAGGNKVVTSPTGLVVTSETTTIATVSIANGTGNITVTGVAVGKTNITISVGALATATIKLVIPVQITKVTAKTVSMAWDKSTYAPGEKMTLTVKALDSDGSGVADGARVLFSDTATANVALGTLPTGTVTLAGGIKTYTYYAPFAAGDITVTAKEGAAVDAVIASTTAAPYTAATITATASVVNASADAATDAANEATDAANAATDAALAAADAADAATAAAEDASAAVATLAKSVNTALANLKKQITALTALVNKLLKK